MCLKRMSACFLFDAPLIIHCSYKISAYKGCRERMPGLIADYGLSPIITLVLLSPKMIIKTENSPIVVFIKSNIVVK